MLRCTAAVRVRVLCLTMLPGGGALTPALRKLGYTPYTLRSTYQQGHASTHPIEWSQLLDGKTNALPATVLADYDAVVGPPGAMVYDVLLRQAPSYTKVILVEEPEKDKWATNYDAYLKRLQSSTERASRSRITKAFQNMINKMVVGGESSEAASTESASSPRVGSSRKDRVTSPGDVRKLFAAEAAELERSFVATKKKLPLVANEVGEHSCSAGPIEQANKEMSNENDGELQHPRAVALQLYEESVKMSVTASALLVYRYGDGWEPLCSFLDKSVPPVPFPEYEDGLRVLGNLQERIDWAHTLQYVMCAFCVLCVLVTVLPRCEGIVAFLKDMYADYQVAFGADSSTPPPKEGHGEVPETEAERFGAVWQKLGGSVTRVANVR